MVAWRLTGDENIVIVETSCLVTEDLERGTGDEGKTSFDLSSVTHEENFLRIQCLTRSKHRIFLLSPVETTSFFI